MSQFLRNAQFPPWALHPHHGGQEDLQTLRIQPFPSLILQRRLQRNFQNCVDDSSQMPGNGAQTPGRAALGFWEKKLLFFHGFSFLEFNLTRLSGIWVQVGRTEKGFWEQPSALSFPPEPRSCSGQDGISCCKEKTSGVPTKQLPKCYPGAPGTLQQSPNTPQNPTSGPGSHPTAEFL